MSSEWVSNPERSCLGSVWSTGAAGLCGSLWLAGGIRSAPLVLLRLLLHLVRCEDRPSPLCTSDRLRDSQRHGEGIIPRPLVHEFSLFGRGHPSVPIALRLHEAVIGLRLRVRRASHREPLFISVGRGWRLGFVSLERVSSPP